MFAVSVNVCAAGPDSSNHILEAPGQVGSYASY